MSDVRVQSTLMMPCNPYQLKWEQFLKVGKNRWNGCNWSIYYQPTP